MIKSVAGNEDLDLGRVGRCIYCGATEGLQDEHPIPFGLAGRHVLHDASCASCAAKTSRWEGLVLRGSLLPFRTILGLPTRRPSGRPTSFPARVKRDGAWADEDLSLGAIHRCCPVSEAPAARGDRGPAVELDVPSHWLAGDHRHQQRRLGITPGKACRRGGHRNGHSDVPSAIHAHAGQDRVGLHSRQIRARRRGIRPSWASSWGRTTTSPTGWVVPSRAGLSSTDRQRPSSISASPRSRTAGCSPASGCSALRADPSTTSSSAAWRADRLPNRGRVQRADQPTGSGSKRRARDRRAPSRCHVREPD